MGSNATYSNLVGVFQRAGYQGYADKVYSIIGERSNGMASLI